MEDLLKKYLKNKVGVDDESLLSEDEQKTFRDWKKVLSYRQSTGEESVSKRLGQQVELLNKSLRAAVKEGKDRDALLITGRIENLEMMILLLEEPDVTKRELKNFLASQTS